MTIDEFINLTKLEPLKYISYCEILITSSGNILMATPSHVEAMINYVTKKYNITREEIMLEIPEFCMPLEWLVDKYKFVAIWYSGYLTHHKGPTKFQKRCINKLRESGLITTDNPYIQKASPYDL